MRPGKYIGIITSILLLAALLLFFTDPWSTLRNEMRKVALGAPDRIDRITLADPYDSTELVRVAGTWMISGTEMASQVAVENLLFAAAHLEIRSILDEQGPRVGSVVRRIEFHSGERTRKSYAFLVDNGRLMMRTGREERTLLLSVPGAPDGDLDRIFSCSSAHYREHLLMDLMPSDIARIRVDLPGKDTFLFAQDPDGNIRCFRGMPGQELPADSLDELSIRLLFSYFTDIRFERPSGIPAGKLASAGSGERELAQLRVESHEGEIHTLKVFTYHELPGEEAHMFLALVLHNEADEAMVVNYIFLDVLMRDLTHYLIGANGAPGRTVR